MWFKIENQPLPKILDSPIKNPGIAARMVPRPNTCVTFYNTPCMLCFNNLADHLSFKINTSINKIMYFIFVSFSMSDSGKHGAFCKAFQHLAETSFRQFFFRRYE